MNTKCNYPNCKNNASHIITSPDDVSDIIKVCSKHLSYIKYDKKKKQWVGKKEKREDL